MAKTNKSMEDDEK